MGVGVSRVTSISAFDDLWRRDILFFSLLSTCLVCFSPAILQKCAAVNTNSAPAVNYSFHQRQGPVLNTLKCTSFDRWRGPSFGIAMPERRSTLPNYQRNCSGISLPLERLSRWNSAARNECHVGRDCTRPQQRIWGGALTPGARRCAPRLPEQPRFKC